MSDLVTLSLDEVHQLSVDALTGQGVSQDQAGAVADIVTAAERDDCKSHGLFRIPGYAASAISGKVTGDAVPEVDDLSPAVIRVDAMNGYAPLALARGCEPLIERARSQGIAAMTVNNNYHFAALWPEVERLCDAGLVGFAFVSAKAFVAPPGGIQALYGTNPMAFGWPRQNGEHMIFDQASSASARGEIMIHQRDGKEIPDGWAIDAEGNPTNDPAAGLAGAQLPFGGYKGGAIALMIELLAGALIGDVFSFEASVQDNADGGPSRGGELLIAIDPARFNAGAGADASMAHAETLFSELAKQEGTRLPSARRYAARQRTVTEGIQIVESLYESCRALCQPG